MNNNKKMSVTRQGKVTRKSYKRKGTIALLSLLCVVLLIAGCGTSKSTSSSNAGTSKSSSSKAAATKSPSSSNASGSNGKTANSSGNGQGSLSSAQLADLKKLVADAQSVPSFTPPGPSVSASKARGDKLLVFPSNSEISYCETEAKDLVKVGKELGISVTNFSTTGKPSQWVQGALQAISSHDNAFSFTCGIPAEVLKPQLLKAKQDKVGSILDQQYNINDPHSPLITAATGIPLLKAETLLADYAMIQNDGKPFHTLVLTANNIVSGVGAANAVKDEFKKRYGSDSSVRIINVPVADWATRMQSTVSSALQNDPKITAVIACFDGMVPNTLPAVEAKKNPKLKIYTYGAGPGVVKLIKNTHGIVAANIGASADWAAYVLMDEFLRVITNDAVSPPNKDYPPLRMWTTQNADEYFAPGGGYGSAYMSGFKKLWGVNQ